MKTERIIAVIGIYGCLIMSNTSKGNIFAWFWVGLAIYWLCRYTYLTFKKQLFFILRVVTLFNVITTFSI